MSCQYLKTQLKSRKTNHYFNDSKRRRMVLSCNKKFSALLKGITSKHDGGFYFVNWLHLFRTRNKLESHRKYVNKKDFRVQAIPKIWWETIYDLCRSETFY